MAKVKEEMLAPVNEARQAMQAIQAELGALALAELRKEALLAALRSSASASAPSSTWIACIA